MQGGSVSEVMFICFVKVSPLVGYTSQPCLQCEFFQEQPETAEGRNTGDTLTSCVSRCVPLDEPCTVCSILNELCRIQCLPRPPFFPFGGPGNQTQGSCVLGKCFVTELRVLSPHCVSERSALESALLEHSVHSVESQATARAGRSFGKFVS